MALFTDGQICGSEDLREYESSILQVARNEGIELTPKLRVAQREIAFELVTFLMRHGAQYLNVRRGLTNVVVTDELRHWHAMQSLAAVYRDAYHQRMNDRYKEKWAHYSMETRGAKERCFATGVGISLTPIPRAAAPVCTTIPGGEMTARTWFVAVALQRNQQAGEISLPIAVDVDAGRLLQVRPADVPAGMEGWSVYVGRDADRLYACAEPGLSLEESWIETGDPLTGRPASPQAQDPDVFVRLDRRIQRG